MTGPWLIVTGDLTPLGGMDVANWGLAHHLAARGPVELVAHRVWPDLATMPNVTCLETIAARPTIVAHS